tara:strand:- start:2905 stop:5946 length:3042 start_codon:yes stop_codon:yes gene_type:complete
MTNKWFFIVALVVSSIAPWASAENAFVLVFLEDAPLRHVKVAVDGKIVGVTDGNGLVQAALEPGPHKLYLIDDDVAIPVKFNLPVGGEVEVSAVFSEDQELEPIVKSQSFTADTDASGYITGLVTSPSGLPIVGALVEVADANVLATTDEEGIYSLVLPRGMHRVDVSRAGYRSSSIAAIRVFADLGVNARFKLLKRPPIESGIAMPTPRVEEVVIIGVFNPTDGAENIERYATTIVSAMDADQMARFGDSDVALAIGRIAGLSVTEGKYANVRGLDGRYIATNFNGILMPSTDPMRRDIQLDLFPSNIVESIAVQKSFSADQLASTTGGSIAVNTKGLPDERVGSLSVSTGFNTAFTFDDVQGYRDSETEWAGFDSGLRDIHTGVLDATDGGTSLTICDPSVADICTRWEVALAYALTFKPDYDLQAVEANPDVGFDVDFGDRMEMGEGELGYFVAASYGRSTNYRGDASLDNPIGLEGMYNRTQDTVSVSGYGVIGYEFNQGEILSKTTLLRSTDDTTRKTLALNVEDVNIDKAVLEYVQRQLFSQSFNGLYEFDTAAFESKIDWRLGYAETDRLEPDRRQYFLQGDSLASSSLERRWSDLNETSNDIGLDYTATFDWGQSNTTAFVVGALLSDKDRTVDLYRFGIRIGDSPIPLLVTEGGVDELLSVKNFAADAFRLRPATASTDSYNSSERLEGYYIQLANDLGDQWSAELGARFESFTQGIAYPNVAQSNSGELEHEAWYPAVNLSWRASEELQFRLGYSKTVSYPGLIERSASQSYDPATDDAIFGTPELTVSEINNIDFRVEYYFGQSNSVSLAVFNKQISNPVERAIPDASGSAADGITFRNQQEAVLDGIELDFNAIVFDQDDHSVFVNGNVSYIDSSVTLGAKSLQLEGMGSDGRQLQGQSEYLANLQIGYDHFPSGQKLTLLVNYFDDRIFRTARGAALGPIIETGRTLIDINYEKQFGEEWDLKFQIKNLTDEPISYSQNNRVIESYELGTSISLSLSYRL